VAKTDEEQAADELLIWRLLAGFHEDETGRSIVDYKLLPDEERRARALLAEQLLDGTLAYPLKRLLAFAIDPDRPSNDRWRPTRKIEFKGVTRGPGSTRARDLVVIYWIKWDLHEQEKAQRHPLQLEAAYATAMEHTGLGRTSVQNIWLEYQEYQDSIAGHASQ
jgi:hypothetical protein